jgi:alkylation response protein AidB-like acyl-CoA dehydrogenase
MEFELTSEQRMIQESAKRMVEREINPILKRHDPDSPLPKEAAREIKKIGARQGLTSARIPESAGGSGMSALTLGLMMEQMPVAAFFLCGDAVSTRIYLGGTPEQRERWLPGIISGDIFASSGLTEASGGSDPRGIRTKAVPDGDHMIVNGHKMWVSGATTSDMMLVTAVVGKDDKDRNIVTRIMVEESESPYIRKGIKTLGLRQGHLGEVFFDNCRVPKGNIIGTPGDASRVLTETWLIQRTLFGLLAVNMAQRAFDAALKYAGERVVFGRKIGGFQLVQQLLADISTAITTSRLLCYYSLSCVDNKRRSNQITAMAKRYSIAACQKAVSMAMEVHGAMGISVELGLEQLYRDIRMLPIPDATNQILTLIEGRELTGIAAYQG